MIVHYISLLEKTIFIFHFHSINVLKLTPVFICLYSGVWCVTQHGKSTLQSSLYWWAPSLDTWCLESLQTGKLYIQLCTIKTPVLNWKCPETKNIFLLHSCRFGRHPVLIISVLFMLVFGLTVAFSVNVPMFSTLRFFEGFCLAGITLSLYVLSKSLTLN